jgi:hypothetical protein
MDNKPILQKETLIFTGRSVFFLYLVLAGQFLGKETCRGTISSVPFWKAIRAAFI